MTILNTVKRDEMKQNLNKKIKQINFKYDRVIRIFTI